MSGQTIRDVIIRVAMEQKTATLQTPKVQTAAQQGVATVNKTAANVARDSFDKEHDAKLKAIEDEIKALNKQLDLQEKIEKSQMTLNRQIDAQKSAVLAAYGAGAAAAMQMAKGIALVSAASEEETEQMVKLIAATQGYFDLGVGGLHMFKAINDVKRQSNYLSVLSAAGISAETGAMTLNAQATTAATGAQMGLNAAMLANPVVLVIAGLAAATIAVRQYAAEEEKAAKDIQENDQRIISRRILRTKLMAELRSQEVETNLRGIDKNDEHGLAQQIRTLEEGRKALAANANMGMDLGSNEGLKQRAEMIKELAPLQQASLNQQIDIENMIVASLERERSVHMDNLALAKQKVVAEQQALETVNQQVGSLNAMDKARAKRIQEQLDKGEAVRHEDLTFAANLRGTDISNIARDRLQKEGEQSGIRVDQNPLRGAKANEQAQQTLFDAAIKDIDAKTAQSNENIKKLLTAVNKQAEAAVFAEQEIQRLVFLIEERKKEQQKNMSLLGGQSWFRIGG